MELRRMMSVGLFVAVASAGVVGCGSDDDASSTTTADTTAGTGVTTESSVEGVTWTLNEINGEAPPAGVTATLVFDGSNVSGSSGCNNYSGEATFNEDVVQISDQLIGTLKACEPAVSEFEASFLQMLPAATLFALDGATLTLSDDADTVLATFTSS